VGCSHQIQTTDNPSNLTACYRCAFPTTKNLPGLKGVQAKRNGFPRGCPKTCLSTPSLNFTNEISHTRAASVEIELVYCRSD
jgi:hypothetical protein